MATEELSMNFDYLRGKERNYVKFEEKWPFLI